MIGQRLKSKPITSLQGVLLILGIVAVILLSNAAGALLAAYIPPMVFQIIIWSGAAVFAFLLMRNRILEYQYTVSGGRFFVERVYGQRTKVVLNVALAEITALGDESQLRAKWPGLGTALRLTLKTSDIPIRALAYNQRGQRQLVLIQPDERIAAELWNKERREASNREKWG